MDDDKRPQDNGPRPADERRDKARDRFRFKLTRLHEGQGEDFIYRLLDAIENNQWPVEIPFAAEMRAVLPRAERNGQRPPGMPPLSQVLRGSYRLSREKVRDMFVDALASAGDDLERAWSSLALLARLDRPCFFQKATAHFEKHPSDDADLRASQWFAAFIADLHEVDAELLPELVASVTSDDRAAGAWLRSIVVDTIVEPTCADQLGLLAVQALCDRLEEI